MQTIGVFDSGMGGLSLLAELLARLPDRDFVYLADNASVPYGNRSPREIRALAARCADFLIGRNAQGLVVACNTVTGACVRELRETLSLPVAGVEPAIKPAVEAFGDRIGVLATRATLNCPKFRTLLEHLGKERFHLFPSADLAKAVEDSFGTGDPTAAIASCLEPVQKAQLSCLVLGCTHYVLVQKEIENLVGVPTLHGNRGVAEQVARRFGPPIAGRTGGFDLFVTRPNTLSRYRAAIRALGIEPLLQSAEEVSL